MMPICNSYTDSHLLHSNQIPSTQNYQPIPPFMMADPSKSIAVSHPWFNSNNSGGYSALSHLCCNCGNSPLGFYSYAPYPHFPSPQFHLCGHHPSFPNAFPVHYVPPPLYLKELPRYDYDKPKDNNFHCCGCPNHSHYQTNGGGVKVEELPNVEKKKDYSSVPIELKKYPFWIPNEYLKKKEHRKPLESDTASRENPSQDLKLPRIVKPCEQEPREWNGWFPPDLNSLQSLMQDNDGRRMQDQQNVDKMRQLPFPIDMESLQSLMQGDDGRRKQDQENEYKVRQYPFPIIWMPPYDTKGESEKEEHQEMNAASKSVKEPVSASKFLPEELPSSDNNNIPQVVHGNFVGQDDSKLKEKCSNRRIIPVKQMEVPSSEHAERREKVASLKNAEDNGMGKASGANTKRELSPPLKASKLPPVCLRVDPLPKKRNSNKSSRSPSRPSFKGQKADTPKESVSSNLEEKNHQESQVQDSILGSSKEEESDKNEERRSDSQNPVRISPSEDSREQLSSSQTTKKIGKNDGKSIIEEGKNLKTVAELTDKQANEDNEIINTDKSCDGKSKAEKKVLSDDEAALHIQSAYRGFEVRKWEPLKKLKQIGNVQEQMAEIRNKIHGLESSPDLQKDEKQRAVLGEMIMNLLLKLDTIQGLHPSLREARKSLARELVALQEKLDLLAQTKSLGDSSCDPKCRVSTEEEESRDWREHPIQNHDMVDAVSDTIDVVSNEQAKQTSNPSLVVKEEWKEFENESQCESLEATGLMHPDENQVNKPEELQQGMIGQKPAAFAEERHTETFITGSVQTEAVESNISCKPTSPTVVVNELTTAEQFAETNLLEELPRGVIDDEEPQKQVLDKMQENEISHGENVIRKATTDASEEQVNNGRQVAYGGDVVRKVTTEASEEQVNNGRKVAFDASLLEQAVVEVLNNEVPSQTDASLPDKEVPSQSESEQQLMEGFTEDLSVLESINCAKVEREKDDVFLGYTISEGDEEQSQAAEVNSNNEQVDGSQPEETQQVSSILQKESHEGVQKEAGQGIIDTRIRSTSEAATAERLSQVEELRIGEKQDNTDQPAEDSTEEELNHQGLEIASSSGEAMNEANIVENSVIESGTEEQVSPTLTKYDEEKKEALHMSSVNNQLHDQEHEIENHRKLVQENDKMREMVEKLIEARKEQLDVINNLTMRVKDLEKKLSTRKKMRTGRCKRATSSPSFTTPSIKFARNGAVSAAL